MTPSTLRRLTAALAGVAVASVAGAAHAQDRELSADELRALAEGAEPWRPSDGAPASTPAPDRAPTRTAAADDPSASGGWIEATAPPRERATPRLRGGVHASLGAMSTVGMLVGGSGVGAEIGVQLTPGLATSVHGYADTVLGLVGRAHAGALVQIAPLRELEVGVGGGVSALYALNFVHPNETANLGVLLLRATVRLPQTGELMGTRPDAWDLVFGAEGEAGLTFDGTQRDANEDAIPQEKGAAGGGVRLLIGFLL